MKRRPPTVQPLRCICEPGPLAASEHARPGKKTALHLNPKCGHSELGNTTRPTPAPAQGIDRLSFG